MTPFVLSRRQIKEADRVGGVELMLPWPAALPPLVLEPDTERPTTPAERAWVEAHIQPVCQAAGLVAVRAFAASLQWPSDSLADYPYRPTLGVVMIGFRWVHASRGTPRPKTLWHRVAG